MKNIIYDGDKYDRIFIHDNNTLMKYSLQPKISWEYLIGLKLDYINTPIKINVLTEEEKKKYNKYYEYKTKIYIPYLTNFVPLHTEKFTKDLNSKEVLEFMKKVLILIKNMHNKKIIHCDLFSKNIMIDKDYNISFIDLDFSIINKIISQGNSYYDDLISKKNKIDYSIRDDKLDILNLFLYYLKYGNFHKNTIDDVNINDLSFPEDVKKELNNIQNSEYIPNNYYFIDIIDYLISIGYESKILSKRL